MVIIGQNNHGKSNLLSAILFFFGEIKHQNLDFNYGSSELYVQLTFSKLDEVDKNTFKKYLTNENQIIVRKTAYLNENFIYKGYIKNPVDERLREVNASAYTNRDTAKNLPFYKLIPEKGRITKDIIINAQLKYIEENISDIQFKFELEQSNFLGIKTVAKGIFGGVYFVPAVREACDDFSSKESSSFGKLYSDIIALMSENNSDWCETKERLSMFFSSLNRLDKNGNINKFRPSQLSEFEAELSKELTSWGAEVNIEVSPPDIENVFKSNTQVWVNDGVPTDIGRKGHGLQRALIFALIQVLANRANHKSLENNNVSSSRKSSKSKYFIFEEPELYLHPQAQRALFESFVKLSESGSQVMLCTHSSGLIDVDRYKSIYIVFKKNESIGTSIKHCTSDLFTGDGKKDFNLSYWINPDRGELFFATKVILVEGPTEKTIIPLLAKNLKVHRYDYTIVDCGSKTSIPLYIQLLNRFEIPYIVVYDKDHQETKSTEATGSADKVNTSIEREIDSSLGRSVILINDIEEEIGLPIGKKSKPYIALNHVSFCDYNLPDSLKQKIISIYKHP